MYKNLVSSKSVLIFTYSIYSIQKYKKFKSYSVGYKCLYPSILPQGLGYKEFWQLLKTQGEQKKYLLQKEISV